MVIIISVEEVVLVYILVCLYNVKILMIFNVWWYLIRKERLKMNSWDCCVCAYCIKVWCCPVLCFNRSFTSMLCVLDDHSRVILDGCDSDYINANYIDVRYANLSSLLLITTAHRQLWQSGLIFTKYKLAWHTHQHASLRVVLKFLKF